MKRILQRLWEEDGGYVLSTEMLMYGTVGAVGMGCAYASVRDAINAELTDVAAAIGSIDQSFCISPVVGHHAFSAGSSYRDTADLADAAVAGGVYGGGYVAGGYAADVYSGGGYVAGEFGSGTTAHGERAVVCADVFGAQADVGTIAPQRGTPHPAPPQTNRDRDDDKNKKSTSDDKKRDSDHKKHDADDKRSNRSDESRRHAEPHRHSQHDHWQHGHSRHVGQPDSVRAVVPYGLPYGLPHGPKGVAVGDARAAYVVGAPAWGFGGAAYGCAPTNVLANPAYAAALYYGVPEGFFNHAAWCGGAAYMRPFAPGYLGGRYQAHPTPVVETKTKWDTVNLGFAKVGDDELRHLDEFDGAKCLHVFGSDVTDKGLGYIAAMDDLESLYLVGTKVTDAGLKQLLKLKKLRFLHLVDTKITDRGLQVVEDMKELEELDVRGTDVTNEGLSKLSKERPGLRVVR